MSTATATAPTLATGEPYLSVKECAALLGCNSITIRRALHRGSIKSVRVGSLYRISPQAVKNYLVAGNDPTTQIDPNLERTN